MVRPGFLFGLDGWSCVATTWFEQAVSGRVIFAGNPAKAWSWVHVLDLADAYCRVVAHAGFDREIFCLADDRQPLCWDVARAAATAAGYAGVVEPGPAIMEDWRAVFDHTQVMNSAKAGRVLGWATRQAGVLAHYLSTPVLNPELIVSERLAHQRERYERLLQQSADLLAEERRAVARLRRLSSETDSETGLPLAEALRRARDQARTARHAQGVAEAATTFWFATYRQAGC